MSISNRPSFHAPAWRAAVVGAVAVLAVGIGVAAGSFVLANRTAAMGGGAAYVPAGAPFYFEMRLQPSAAQDAALRELLGRFPLIEGVDLERPLYEQLTERLDELIADEQQGISWSEDVAPWFDGRIGLAVLEIPTDSLLTPEAPPMVVLLGVTDPVVARASIDRIIASAEVAPSFTEQSHAGVTIRVADDEGAYAVTDDQVLIAPAAADIVSALDAHASGSTTLAEVDEISRLTDALPADWLAFGVYDLTDLMSTALSQAAAASPGMADAFEALLEHQPLRGAVAVTAAGDRLAIDVVSDSPTGPLTVENAERGLAAEVPADTLYYAEAGNLGATMAAVIESFKAAVAGSPEGSEVDTMEAALGVELEELVSWIEDGAVAVGWDGTEPYGGMVLVPNDVDAARRRLSQLATFAGLAGTDPASGVSIEEDEVGSVSVTTIRWEDPDAVPDTLLPVPTGVVVQYAVTDDRALIGLGDAFVGRVLELDAADALASLPRYGEAVASLGGSSNTGETWVDLAGIREAVGTVMGSALDTMDADDVVYAGLVHPWLLPLDRYVTVGRLEGDLLIQRSALLVE